MHFPAPLFRLPRTTGNRMASAKRRKAMPFPVDFWQVMKYTQRQTARTSIVLLVDPRLELFPAIVAYHLKMVAPASNLANPQHVYGC